MPKKKNIKHKFGEEITKYIGAGFGLIAGLAWNDAIKSFIEYAFPLDKNSMWAKFLYAIIMTVIVAFVGLNLERIFKKEEQDEAANKNKK